MNSHTPVYESGEQPLVRHSVFKELRWAGFEPASSGYEPDKEPLLYPAYVGCDYAGTHRRKRGKQNYQTVCVTRTGLEPVSEA